MKIAIIGSGAAGLSAFWALNQFSEHEAEIFEAESDLGGHAHAICVQVPGKKACWVDTAFIMLNQIGYPIFWQFLKAEGIPLVKTNTSFSVTRGALSWGSRSLSALFATPNSLYSGRLWGMVFDLFRFHYNCLDVLDPHFAHPGMSVGEYLEFGGYQPGFIEDYLLPLAATYWSLPPARILQDCPIVTLVRNFDDHGLLQMWNRPTWYTIEGGSRTYVDAIARTARPKSIHVSTPITAVEKTPVGIKIVDKGGDERLFDHVILATHADTTLRLLNAGNSASAADEKALMDASDWSRFEIVMHYDERSMPQNRKVWGAWNTFLPPIDTGPLDELDTLDSDVSCTFDMNLLHNIPVSTHGHIMGTLNPPNPINPRKIFGRFTYATPIFTERLIAAQTILAQTARLRHQQGLSIVGAWTGLGTHEDAWSSGISVAMQLGAKIPFDIAPKGPERRYNSIDLVVRSLLMALNGVRKEVVLFWLRLHVLIIWFRHHRYGK